MAGSIFASQMDDLECIGQPLMDGCFAITGHDDDPMHSVLERRLPVRSEFASNNRAFVTKSLSVRELTTLERGVLKIVRNGELTGV